MDSNISIDRLISGPVITNSPMVMNFQVHLVHGCSYTISLWMWLWKPKNLLNRREMIIFSTRTLPSEVQVPQEEPILPAIIFNAGWEKYHADRYFASSSRDENGEYYGVWPDYQVRYHEWTHLAVVIDNTSMFVYIDGNLILTSTLDTHIHDQPPSCPYTNPENTIPTSNFVNNVILQVFGSRKSQTLSTPGMVQDFIFMKNVKASHSQIQSLMELRKPIETPTLDKLMRDIGKYSLKDFSPLPWKMEESKENPNSVGNPYLLASWGICPEILCGHICLAEGYLLGATAGGNPGIEIPWKVSPSAAGQRLNVDMNGVSSTSAKIIPKYSASEIEEVLLNEALELNEAMIKELDGELAMVDGSYADYHYSNDYVYTPYDFTYTSYDYSYSYEYPKDGQAEYDDYANVNADDGGIGAFLRREQQIIKEVGKLIEEDPALAEILMKELVDEMNLHQPIGGQLGGFDMNELNLQDMSVENIMKLFKSTSDTDTNVKQKKNSKNKKEQKDKDMKAESPSGDNKSDNEDTLKTDALNALKNNISFDHYSKSFFNKTLPRKLHLIDTNRDKDMNIIERAVPRSKASLLPSWLTSATASKNISMSISMSTLEKTYREMLTRQKNLINLSRFGPKHMQQVFQIEELYESAIALMNGRTEQHFPQAQHQDPDQPRDQDISPSRTSEPILSALSLAFWLADDLYDPAIDVDVAWSFNYAGVLSHALHLVLGFHFGKDRTNSLLVDIPAIQEELFSHAVGSRDILPLLAKDPGIHRHIQFQGSGRDESLNDDLAHLLDILTRHDGDDEEDILSSLPNGSFAIEAKFQGIRNAPANILLLLNSFNKLVDQTAEIFFDTTEGSFFTSIQSDGQEINESTRGLNCGISNYYYFLVAQYVSSHFGVDALDVSLVEDVKLRDENSLALGAYGALAEYQMYTEADAKAGDVGAQLWLAKRFLWGQGGVRRNHEMARVWFERAAEAGNAEGMFNVGAMYLAGNGGLERNRDKAVEYFKIASNGSDPFPFAVYALGNIYADESFKEYNITLAKDMFEKAASLGNSDAHFSLAAILISDTSNNRNIPLALVYLCHAVSARHLRAMGYLAHGLFDPESWLHQYIRVQDFKRMNDFEIYSKNKSNNILNSKSPPADNTYDNNNNSKDNTNNETDSKEMKFKVLKYNSSQPITVRFDGRMYELPRPFGNGDGCTLSMEIFKYISEYIHKTSELTMSGLSEYLGDNPLAALELYDEASVLGVGFAQDNAVYLYIKLKHQVCKNTTSKGMFNTLIDRIFGGLESSYTDSIKSQDLSHSFLQNVSYDDCVRYFNRMEARRLMQLTRGSDPFAKREVAKAILDETIPRNVYNASTSDAIALLAVAIQEGDSESVFKLGWVFYFGAEGFESNKTAAKNIFLSQLKFNFHRVEGVSLRSTWTSYFAAALALMYIYFDEVFAYCEEIIGRKGLRLQLYEIIIRQSFNTPILVSSLAALIASYVFLYLTVFRLRNGRQANII